MCSEIKNLIIAISLFFLAMISGLPNSYAEVSQASENSLKSKGIAIYQELGIEYYVANLNLSDINVASADILQFEGEQSLIIKVTTKRWSARKWKAQWQNNIAINNEPTTDAQLIDQLAHFTQFPKGSLISGDEVVIKYSEDLGSRVSFNGHPVLSTNNKDFYRYILNTWLGKFSPNRIFREKISGQAVLDYALLEVSRLPVELTRIDKVKPWFSAEIELEAKRKQQELAEQQRRVKLEQEKKKRIASENARLQEQIRQEQVNLETARKKAEALKQAKLVAERKAKEKIENEKKERLRKQKLAKLEQKRKQRAAIEEAKKEELRAINKQKYLYELYQWELQAKLNEAVVYPPWARQFNQEGRVSLVFSINRAGNIVNLDSGKSLASKILLQEVEKRLTTLVEAYPITKELKGDSWPFTINYVFSLGSDEQKPLTKPQLAVFD